MGPLAHDDGGIHRRLLGCGYLRVEGDEFPVTLAIEEERGSISNRFTFPEPGADSVGPRRLGVDR